MPSVQINFKRQLEPIRPKSDRNLPLCQKLLAGCLEKRPGQCLQSRNGERANAWGTQGPPQVADWWLKAG